MIEAILITIGLILNAFELRQNRKSLFIEINYKNRERYNKLLEARQDIEEYYRDRNFDLERIKKSDEKLYSKIIQHELTYFWFVFDTWVESHIRKSVPSDLIRDWDYGVKSGMRNPVHKQSWQTIKRDIDFLGYKEFYEFIEECVEGRCGTK